MTLALKNEQNLGRCKEKSFRSGEAQSKGVVGTQAWLSLGAACGLAEPEQKPVEKQGAEVHQIVG